MKEEKSQMIPQKYKQSSENTMHNLMPTIGQPRRNGQVSRNKQPTKNESRRNG